MDLDFERIYWQQGNVVIAGIDEVGRGCLAGPVVAAAVIFPATHQPIPGVNDSKLLSALKREQLAAIIKQQALFCGIGSADNDYIDTDGIIPATSRAMHKALKNQLPDIIAVDGTSSLGLEDTGSKVIPVVHGDRLVYSIAAASILAKVWRDRLMQTYHRQLPHYAWDCNKGYGTKAHYQALTKHGLSTYHRKTFIHSLYPIPYTLNPLY